MDYRLLVPPQVCGGIDVREHCNPPDRTPEYHKGTAMQLWGNVFHCPSGDCDTNCSTLANCTGDNCCTAKCEVLAIGTPTWSLADSTNVHTGGLIATFPPIQRSSNGSLQCLHVSRTLLALFSSGMNNCVCTLFGTLAWPGLPNRPVPFSL